MERTAAPRSHLRARQPAKRRSALPALIAAAAVLTGCARPLPPDDHSRAATAPAPPIAAPTASPSAAAEQPPPDPFATTVRPILTRSCAPCHEPNGQMYSKLPFDKPEVIASHSSGVLRRLKGEDKEALARWIATQAPAPAHAEKRPASDDPSGSAQ
jgi:cytochrome c553